MINRPLPSDQSFFALWVRSVQRVEGAGVGKRGNPRQRKAEAGQQGVVFLVHLWLMQTLERRRAVEGGTDGHLKVQGKEGNAVWWLQQRASVCGMNFSSLG